MSKLISGAGGGGGSRAPQQTIVQNVVAPTRTPVRDPDTLASKQYATFVDLLGEGEIEGFPSARAYARGGVEYNVALLKDIYLNNTPILRAAADPANPQVGDYNFQDIKVDARYGTQNQSYVFNASAAEDEKTVNTVVEQATPVTRTITETEIDSVRVTITVPRLERYTNEGDVLGTSVQLQVQLSYNGGAFTTVIDDTITGRTADQYQRDYLINLAATRPVDVRVVRVTADSGDTNLINAFFWTSYTEIINEKLRYPNSALVAMRIDAEQFNSIPSRSFRIRGLKVRIPSNGTVDQANGRITYSGVWDGTFAAAQWTSDPAWILWDLLTSTRYGFGDHIQAAQLDKWAFYSASAYASELVPTGFGGTEPRFSCNALIQNAEEAYKLIGDLCSVMRVMPYWSTGTLTISQDKPTAPSYLFTLANVSEEGFSYSGSSLKTRHTVAVVSYLDLETRDLSYEVVEDKAGIAKYGVITTQVKAFACTSRGQAARLGEWLLYSEQNETEIINFTASIEAGVLVRPGQVIEVADPVRSGVRRGGRISAATTTAITVDDATGLTLGTAPTLSVILPDGTVQSRAVSSIAGDVITVSSAFSSAPNVNSIWVLQNSSIETSQWRVLSVQEQDGSNYAITALAYNATKYDYIERDRPLQQRTVSLLNQAPATPSNLQANEALYESNGRALAKIIVSWRPVVGVSQYRIQWRQQNGNWVSETIPRPDYEILDTAAARYEIQVYALSATLKPSVQPATLTFNAQGKTAPPVAVTGLYANIIDPQTVELAWNLHPDLDVRVGGKILIRHTPRTTGAAWVDATTIVPAVTGNQTRKNVPFVAGTYLLRAQDDLGNLSADATSIVVEAQAQPQPVFVLRVGSSPVSQPTLTFAEDLTSPPFQGTATDMLYSVEQDGLILTNAVAWDSLPGLVDDYTSIDAVGGIAASGEYQFANTLDLGAVYEVNLRGRFVTRAFNPGNLWDDIPDVDALVAVDDVVGNPDAELQFRYSTNGIAYSNWIPYQSNLVRGRSFQFKVVATSGDQRENILIEELGMTALLQQQSQAGGPITSGAGTYSATFTNPFYSAPQVSITAENMATGDYATIANITRTGFQVTFRNSGGTAVSRQFHYLATGYGKEIL
jgi:predicted phage tail protein